MAPHNLFCRHCHNYNFFLRSHYLSSLHFYATIVNMLVPCSFFLQTLSSVHKFLLWWHGHRSVDLLSWHVIQSSSVDLLSWHVVQSSSVDLFTHICLWIHRFCCAIIIALSWRYYGSIDIDVQKLSRFRWYLRRYSHGCSIDFIVHTHGPVDLFVQSFNTYYNWLQRFVCVDIVIAP